MLRQARPDDEMLELVHRLDRETSGCLVIAKTLKTLNQLHQHFRDKAEHMEKIYHAIVLGRWQGREKIIDLPLLKGASRGGERFVEVNSEGKEARSLFMPLEYKNEMSLMEVKLFTGRTHQIRVHAQATGYPIAGDTKYGNKEFNAKLKKRGYKRMYLHAYKLSFSLGTQHYNICAPMDSEWKKLFNEHT